VQEVVENIMVVQVVQVVIENHQEQQVDVILFHL
jgi:hypothetical protein